MMMKATAAGRPRTEDETSARATRIAWIWIENEEGLYNAVNEQANAEGQTVDALADYVRDLLTENGPSLGASVWADLLDLALESVDYYQIAADLLADVNPGTK